MIDQRTLLAGCGRALYGPSQPWQSALARDLGVADRTVRRWISGASTMPDGARQDLVELMKQRSLDLDMAVLAVDSGVLPADWD